MLESPTSPTITRYTPASELPKFLTAGEAADFLNIGRTAIYDLLKRDELEHRRFGRLIRIPREALVSKAAK